jgi:flagellar motor protein MotB
VKPEISTRWAISFADLIMLLLAFFVMMQAQAHDRLKMMAGIRNAFGGSVRATGVDGFTASALFQPGEAILKAEDANRFVRIGAEALKAGERVSITAQGREKGSARLDSWELAAARTAAVARAIEAGGLPENRIDIAIPTPPPEDREKSLRINIQRSKM